MYNCTTQDKELYIKMQYKNVIERKYLAQQLQRTSQSVRHKFSFTHFRYEFAEFFR